jgi:hypothetical protein
MNEVKNKPWNIFNQGFLLGTIGLSTFYYLLLFLITRDPNHPFTQFKLFQPWMSLLIIGFGIQMGLFWMMRKGFQFNLSEKKDSKMTAGTSTAVSGMAMVACCAHHAVDLLPILGFSAAALFLSEYQEQLLIFGVVANVIGIGMMLWFLTGKVSSKKLFSFISTKFRRSA